MLLMNPEIKEALSSAISKLGQDNKFSIEQFVASLKYLGIGNGASGTAGTGGSGGSGASGGVGAASGSVPNAADNSIASTLPLILLCRYTYMYIYVYIIMVVVRMYCYCCG